MTLLADRFTRPKMRLVPPERRDLLWKALNYQPTPAQLTILEDDHTEKLVSGGFRAGKSATGAMAVSLLTAQFIADYGEKAAGQVAWLVGQDYERTRAEFDSPGTSIYEVLSNWGLVKDKSKRVDPGQIEVKVMFQSGGQMVEAKRPFIIKTKSASDETSLGMEGPVWILICEAAHVSHDVYLRLRSRVSEARAKFPGYGVLFMEGTMEGSLGWYASTYTLWQSPSVNESQGSISFNLPSESNLYLYPLGANDPEIIALKKSLPEEVFLERHMGVPAPPKERVHDTFDARLHVRRVVYNPTEPVYLAIDPGYSGQPSHYAVEAAQLINGQWRVFWEFWNSGYTTQEVIRVVKSQPFWGNKDKVGVIDVAGNAHSGAMESNTEIWFKETGLLCQNQKVQVLLGVNKFNEMLITNPLTGEPRLVIDPSCRGVLSELGICMPPDLTRADETATTNAQMRIYSFATDKQGTRIGTVPKDRYNDGIKALTYLFVGREGYARHDAERKIIRARSWLKW